MIIIIRNIIDYVLIFLSKITKTDLLILSYKQKGIFNFSSDTGEQNVLRKEIKKYLGEKPIFFDVGANVGEYTEKIINEYPDSEIFCFEPHPINYSRLVQKINHENIHHYNLGLGKENIKTKIFDKSNNDGSQHASIFSSVITEIHKKESTEHEIELRRLKDFCLDKKINKINFLKLDTEGSEFEILNSSKEFLNNIDIIQFEFNEMNIYSRTFFRDFYQLLNKDFSLFRIMPNKIERIYKYNTKLEVFKFQNFLAIHKNIIKT